MLRQELDHIRQQKQEKQTHGESYNLFTWITMGMDNRVKRVKKSSQVHSGWEAKALAAEHETAEQNWQETDRMSRRIKTSVGRLAGEAFISHSIPGKHMLDIWLFYIFLFLV